MDNLFTYSTEEKLFFNFNFTLNEKNEIKITIQEINQDETITSLPYISVYNLNYLNQRLEKFIHFNNITKFRDCLISNLNEKTLIIKPPYKNAVATKWRIFPKNSIKKTHLN